MPVVVENFTPWPHLAFERADLDDRLLQVVVMQGSFRVVTGEPLEPLPDQEPVYPVDVYRGEPGSSSLVRAGAVATVKPRTDVTLDAVARSPQPEERWEVRLTVGDLQHRLGVLAPQRWTRDEDGAWAAEPRQPCGEVSIVYERAFGGAFERGGEIFEEPRNPVGTGLTLEDLVPEEHRGDDPPTTEIWAPQIVGVDDPPFSPGASLTPRGWGAIPSSFAPRRDRVGTCDDEWLRTRWPCLPKDFDDDFYQSAHPELVYPGYLRGDEVLRVDGVTRDGAPVEARLPGWLVWVLLRLHGGRLVAAPARLDSLHLDLTSPDRDDHRAYLGWRAVFPSSPGIRLAEVRMHAIDQRRAA